ncbi:MAG: hypothetical protein AB7W59_03305 [Acidimicrobiia bacterium]
MRDPNAELRALVADMTGATEVPPASAEGQSRADLRPAVTAAAAQQPTDQTAAGPRGGVASRSVDQPARMAIPPAGGHVARTGASPEAAASTVQPARMLPCAPATGPAIDLDALAPGDVVAWSHRGDVQVGFVTGISRAARLAHLIVARSGGRARIAKPLAELTLIATVDQLDADARRTAQ